MALNSRASTPSSSSLRGTSTSRLEIARRHRLHALGERADRGEQALRPQGVAPTPTARARSE